LLTVGTLFAQEVCIEQSGGLAGHGVAEMIDPTAEDAYWRANYEKQDYVAAGSTYDDYGPAYRYGVDSYGRYKDRSFDEVESDLKSGWEKFEGRRGAGSTWDSVKSAVRDAWHRITGEHDLDADRMSESEVDGLSQSGRARSR